MVDAKICGFKIKDNFKKGNAKCTELYYIQNLASEILSISLFQTHLCKF